MAICGTCQSETTRVNSVLRHGKFVDQCPACSPELFKEKVSDPSTKKLWMGWETNPAHYKKTEDGYQASDSLLADLEAKILRPDPEEVEREQKALEARRAYAARHRKAETDEERLRNDTFARELVQEAERKASLMSMGVVLPENQ